MQVHKSHLSSKKASLVALYVSDLLNRTGSEESLVHDSDYSGCAVCF